MKKRLFFLLPLIVVSATLMVFSDGIVSVMFAGIGVAALLASIGRRSHVSSASGFDTGSDPVRATQQFRR